MLTYDPLVFRHTPFWPNVALSKPGLIVCVLSCRVAFGVYDINSLSLSPWRVPVDFAGDLSQQPQGFITPAAGDYRHGVTHWYVGAIGFTEYEALEALSFIVAKYV